MGTVKNSLKKILPPPVNSFMREVNRIVALEEKNQELMNQLVDKMGRQQHQIEMQNAAIEYQDSMLKEQNNLLMSELSILKNQMLELDKALEQQNSMLLEQNDLLMSELSILKNQMLELDKALEQQNSLLKGQNDVLISELSNQKEQIYALDKVLGQQNLMLKEQVNTLYSLDRKIPQPVAYNNDWERKVIASFRDVMVKESFPNDFMNLINGLDEESIKTIILLLKRQAQVIDKKGENQFIYSKEEQAAIQVQRDDFSKYKMKVADDIYIYKEYLLPVDHFEASVFYHKHGLESIQNISLVKNKDIIDVGGFIGDSCLIFAPLTDKCVYTFESVSENYEMLLKTVALNGLKNIVPEKMALGAEQKEIVINIAGSCSSILTPPTSKVDGQEIVMMTSLDLYMKKHPEIEPGLIKVDIEGFEQEFLKGAVETIKKYRPILLISIYHNVDDFFKIKPMIESWDLGYRFKVYNPIDGSVSREVLLIAEFDN